MLAETSVAGTAPGRVRPALVEPGPPLSNEQVQRWSRHLLLPEVGEIGQRRLRNARVLVVGAGGLGAPVLLYLAAAGIGRLGIVDHDEVELTNLQRQVIHGWADVGRPKVDSAREAVHAVDDGVEVVTHPVRLTEENVDDVLRGYDLVLDGTDNFPTRYLVNDACVRLGLPEVWASIYRFDAQVSVFWGRPPTGSGVDPVQLRDLFPAAPEPGSVPSCAEGGVLGAMCGQVGSVMATEAIKLITGIGDVLLGRVLVLDVLGARWTEVPLAGAGAGAGDDPGVVRDPAAVNGSRFVNGSGSADDEARSGAGMHDGAMNGSGPIGVGRGPAWRVPEVPTISATELADRLAARDAGADRFELVDVREPGEWAIVSVPGSRLVPLGHLMAGDGLAEVPDDVPVVLLCHSGVRSEHAVHLLRAAGRRDVSHLDGGILAWVADVDPSLPTY